VLKAVNQPSLAYLTAATHGLKDEAAALAEDLHNRNQTLPPVDPNARLLVPPPPIQQCEDNWPQLTVSRGPFESQLGGGAATTTKSAAAGKGARAAAAFLAAEDEEMVSDRFRDSASLDSQNLAIG
jgi:coatomer protein complex subunit alpha (xenin)